MLRDTKSANRCHTAVYFQQPLDFKVSGQKPPDKNPRT